MKKILMIAVIAVLGLVLATPVLADHRDHYRGHPVRFVRGGYHGGYYYPRPRYRSRLFFGFGVPLFAPAPAYLYAPPPPYVVEPGYYEPVWVPGHYAYQGGARFYIAGTWSR